ncbi:hypothetical protein ACQ856_18230 [Mycolicibacterium psychrotolerans]|uniref:hypothetical protein n=1 Tax=Mycolicibacterium psychrotolerans TaxID=216929 RepID=UPI003D6685C7
MPPATLKRLGATPKIVEALVSATLWEHAENGGIRFTRWQKWQRTKAEIDAYNKKEAQRKKDERDAAKAAANSDDAKTSDRTSAGQPQDVRPDVPDPSYQLEVIDSYLSRELTAVGSNPTSPPPLAFPDHCTNHRHDPEPGKCNDCRRVREQNHHAETVAEHTAADERTRAAQRRDACWDCDPNGLRYADPNDLDSALIRCEHPDVP